MRSRRLFGANAAWACQIRRASTADWTMGNKNRAGILPGCGFGGDFDPVVSSLLLNHRLLAVKPPASGMGTTRLLMKSIGNTKSFRDYSFCFSAARLCTMALARTSIWIVFGDQMHPRAAPLKNKKEIDKFDARFL